MTYEYKGNHYTLIANTSFKHPETREWVPAVLYGCNESLVMYVREKEEFFKLFKKV